MESIIAYLLNTFTVTKAKVILSVIYSWFSYMIWGYTLLVESMYVLLIIDFILGFNRAWVTHTLSRKKMQLWIVKIISYSVTLIVINYADIATLHANIMGIGIKELGVAYLAVNEALSCSKHLSLIWVPLPMGVVKKLELYRDNLNSADFK